MGQIEVFSPAKINLFLSVLGRMPTGFHELVSLVAPLSFGDRIGIESEAGERRVELRCDDESLPTDEGNLAYRAAWSFLERFGLQRTVRLNLRKRIPHGAGLGGGSSNASVVLNGLALLEGIDDPAGLLELATALGSDCPLFLGGKPVVMRGRGEVLNPLGEPQRQGLKGREVLLFKPSFSMPTVWGFKAMAEDPLRNYDEREWTENQIRLWEVGDLDLIDLLHNSFEKVAFEKYVIFRHLGDRLSELGEKMLLSGSGSCCFVLLRPESDLEAIRATVRDAFGEKSFFEFATIL